MNVSITMSLSEVFNQIDNTPEPIVSKCIVTTINSAIDNAENYLDSLQNLKDILTHKTENLTKPEVLKLMQCIRRVYTTLGVQEEIKDYWLQVRGLLNNPKAEFVGKEMAKELLLNKHVIILNRTVFAAKRRKETLIKTGQFK